MPDSSERKKAWNREYHAANAEARNARSRERYRLKREVILAKQAEYRAANPEKIAARRAAYQAANAEELRRKRREHYRKNRDERLAVLAAYRSRPEYREEQRRRMEAWWAANPNLKNDYNQMRRAAKRVVAVEPVRRAEVWERDGGVCQICGDYADPEGWHLDHVVPLAAGGPHTYANVIVSHPACNNAKGSKDPRLPGSPYWFLLLNAA